MTATTHAPARLEVPMAQPAPLVDDQALDTPRRSKICPLGKGRTITPTRAKNALATRAYAEQWYQTLREWRVTTLTTPGVAIGSPHGARFQIVGSGTAGGGYGGVGTLRTERIALPSLGDWAPHLVGRAITDMTLSEIPETVQLGRMLERIRAETSPQSLVRDGGWAWPRERTARYAVAVLTLAVRLGDHHAQEPLRECQQLLANLAKTAR